MTYLQLQNKLRPIIKHHPMVFFFFLKYTILLNVVASAVGGLLWITLWGAANNSTSGYDLYWKLQPLADMPEWIPRVISYGFTIVIILNIILFCLFMVYFVIDKTGSDGVEHL